VRSRRTPQHCPVHGWITEAQSVPVQKMRPVMDRPSVPGAREIAPADDVRRNATDRSRSQAGEVRLLLPPLGQLILRSFKPRAGRSQPLRRTLCGPTPYPWTDSSSAGGTQLPNTTSTGRSQPCRSGSGGRWAAARFMPAARATARREKHTLLPGTTATIAQSGEMSTRLLGAARHPRIRVIDAPRPFSRRFRPCSLRFDTRAAPRTVVIADLVPTEFFHLAFHAVNLTRLFDLRRNVHAHPWLRQPTRRPVLGPNTLLYRNAQRRFGP
jgi:hypothetical protein